MGGGGVVDESIGVVLFLWKERECTTCVWVAMVWVMSCRWGVGGGLGHGLERWCGVMPV